MDDSGGEQAYRRVDSLVGDNASLAHDKRIKIKHFPTHHKVTLFRVEVSTHRTDWIVTNHPTQHDTLASQEVCDLRWKCEQCHRKAKQTIGIELC